jgi:paraquat-inducible protein B
MSKQANPTLIGGFVLGAVVLIVAALLVFGRGDVFVEKRRFVLFFEGSVNGLEVGAPVKLRGVTVGKVVDYKAVFSRKQTELWIPVIIEFEEQRVDEIDNNRAVNEEEQEQEIQRLIGEGLRGQLALQSYVTGRLFIQIDFFPDTTPQYRGVDMKYPEIPTIPSATEELQGNFRALLDKVNELPLEDLLLKATATLQGIEHLVNDPAVKDLARHTDQTVLNLNVVLTNLDDKLGELTAELDGTLEDTRNLVNHVDRQVDPLASGGVQTLAVTREALAEARMALSNVKEVTAKDSPLRHDFTNALKQLAAAARSIRNMADYLERNPNAIIYGKDSQRGR